jgi:hypothetical protein
MKGKLIEFKEESVTIHTDTPKTIGTEIDLEVRLPQGILARSFLLRGTITGCECLRNGSRSYKLEIKIGDLSPLNLKIFHAYKDFLEREQMLNRINVDLKAFQQAFRNLEAKLRQLRKTVTQVRDNLRGTLGLMQGNGRGNATIH